MASLILVALMTVCTTILLPMIATAAGEEGAFFEAAFAAGPPMAFLRPLHYPPVPSDPATVACGAHTDYGLVTLLHTDGGPGLEVEVGGAWRSVPPPAHDGDGATRIAQRFESANIAEGNNHADKERQADHDPEALVTRKRGIDAVDLDQPQRRQDSSDW